MEKTVVEKLGKPFFVFFIVIAFLNFIALFGFLPFLKGFIWGTYSGAEGDIYNLTLFALIFNMIKNVLSILFILMILFKFDRRGMFGLIAVTLAQVVFDFFFARNAFFTSIIFGVPIYLAFFYYLNKKLKD